MKKCFYASSTCIACLLLLLVLTAYQTPGKPRFYYAFNKKIFLDPVRNRFTVTFGNVQQANLAKTNRAMNKVAMKWKNARQAVIDIGSTQSITEVINTLDGIQQYQPVYKAAKQELYLTDEVILKLKPGVTLQSVWQRAGLRSSFTTINKPYYNIVRVSKDADVLEVANKIQETGLTVYSYPNFIAPVELHQNDPYFPNQFYLHNTGQVFNPVENHSGTPGADIAAVGAWNVTTGHPNIIVAVIDQGITTDHPDLPASRQLRLPGSNFMTGENPDDPSPINQEAHGNACAGIIAATQNNNEGITGVAPGVRIMPIRILGEGYSVSNNSIADAIDFAWQHGADVLSNSWGFQTTDPNAVPAIVEAIQRAVTLGRGGLGSVVCFSASNTATHNAGGFGEVRFPANVMIPGVLTVGASDRYDEQADYSPTSNIWSAENQIIDIVAPSHKAFSYESYGGFPGGLPNEGYEIWTMDLPGDAGFNPWKSSYPVIAPAAGESLPAENTNYTGRMGGTSAACPQVAAVAALILSVNNTYTQQEVFDLLTKHADKTGSYTYDTTGWCAQLGYGRLNACAALSSIPNVYPFIISGATELCSGSTYSVLGLPAGAIITGWTSSDTAVATITADGIANRTGNGAVTFTATISIPNRCGTTTKSIRIYAGLPPLITGTIAPMFDTTSTCYLTKSSKTYTFGLNPMNNGAGINNYYWGFYDSQTGDSNNLIQSTTNPSFDAGFPYAGDYILFVRPVNGCGLGNIITRNIMADDDCSSAGTFTVVVSPNPAKNIAYVTIDQNRLLPRKLLKDESVYIELFNFYTGQRQKEWCFKYKVKHYVLNLSGLRDGPYVLRVTQGRDQRSMKLILR
jgi:subtilisin family serine protease